MSCCDELIKVQHITQWNCKNFDGWWGSQGDGAYRYPLDLEMTDSHANIALVYHVCILYFTLIVPDNSFNHDIFIIIYIVILITYFLRLHILPPFTIPFACSYSKIPLSIFMLFILHPIYKRKCEIFIFSGFIVRNMMISVAFTFLKCLL